MAMPTDGTAGGGGERALTARSVVASVLLGTEPPELPARLLVRSGELFGIAEGTTRVALSRMVSAGEVEAAGDGRYRLSGHLMARRARQDQARRPQLRGWDGSWRTAIVTAESRPAAERAAWRATMRGRRMAELREGVWLRPDNLAPPPADPLDEQCTWFTAVPAGGGGADLAGPLWDLESWRHQTSALLARMDSTVGSLRSGDLDSLAPCFVLAAAALRHLTADPLLPAELLPRGWNGEELRTAYDAYESALQGLLRNWFRDQRADRPSVSVKGETSQHRRSEH
jgi:phenylacetic acid degradation operon negative regulatory protein